MEQWTNVFRALGNPDRLRLFLLLARQGQGICVCELVEALGLPQYQVSKHLRALRQVGLIESVRVGRWAYYSVAPAPAAQGLSSFLLREIPKREVTVELRKLREVLSRRVAGRCVVGRRQGGENG